MLDYARIMIQARLAKMDDRGATAVEYGLLVVGIGIAIIAAIAVLANGLDGLFRDAGAEVNPATP